MNTLLAQIDRRLARRGELIYLRRTVGSTNQSYVQISMLALVRTLTVQQLIGNITQTNFVIICSPTDIIKQQWPGGQTATVTVPITGATDTRIPNVNDKVYVRGAQKAIQRIAPVFDRGECIRLEINVLG
jgi:hypothetical protein